MKSISRPAGAAEKCQLPLHPSGLISHRDLYALMLIKENLQRQRPMMHLGDSANAGVLCCDKVIDQAARELRFLQYPIDPAFV